MKTYFVDGKEYQQVPEKLNNSCEQCAFEGRSFDLCKPVQCDTGHFILKEISKKQPKTKKVSFYRYHRPIDHKTGYAKSDQGVTLFVKINYKKRTLRVSCSVCDGDNFSKVNGKFLASVRYDEGRYLEFPLNDYVNSSACVLDYLRITLDDECHLPEFEAAVKQLRRNFA